MITVTGATGQLGHLVIRALLDQGVPAENITAAARRPEQADLGVRTVLADYSRPQTLAGALAGTDRLLLISSNEVGSRVQQHSNMIEAAKAAGVSLIAYTSVLRADTARMTLAAEHLATEEIIRESGLPFVLLRNSWYTENYTAALPLILQHRAVLGSAGDGRVSAATRADYAAAAAAVLTAANHMNAVYELGGDEPFTLAELATEITRQTGTEITYHDLPVEEYTRALVGAGMPEPVAAQIADSNLGIARGEVYTDSGDLRKLIGRPTTTLAAAIEVAIRA
ncbi:MAG: SDR family oxidoreductase [Pseudonocardiaceae bacterium]